MENKLQKAAKIWPSLSLTVREGKIEIEVSKLSTKQAFRTNNHINKLLKADAETSTMTRAFLVGLVKDLSDFLDCNKRLKTGEDYKFTVQSLIEQRPDWTLEEFANCFKLIKQGSFGKLFERLKTAEILDILSRYEIYRINEREALRKEQDQQRQPERSENFTVKYVPQKKNHHIKEFLHLSQKDLIELGQVKPKAASDE